MTDEEVMRAAFQALLRGDTAERDSLLDPLLAREKMRRMAHTMVDPSDEIVVKQPNGGTITFKTVARQ